jgi:hypothetical protein
LPTAARRSTQRFGDLTFGISLVVIDNVGNAQRGMLQPQIISPYLLMEALMKCVPALPRSIIFPFPLSKDSAVTAPLPCTIFKDNWSN